MQTSGLSERSSSALPARLRGRAERRATSTPGGGAPRLRTVGPETSELPRELRGNHDHLWERGDGFIGPATTLLALRLRSARTDSME